MALLRGWEYEALPFAIPVRGRARAATGHDSGPWRGAGCHRPGFRFVAEGEPATGQDSGPWQGAGLSHLGILSKDTWIIRCH